jgi:excisionase family DNA binding protein
LHDQSTVRLISGIGRNRHTEGNQPPVRYEPDEQDTPVTSRSQAPETLLTPAEVAALFRVDPKTVTRWAIAGKLEAIRTLGGHRRYRESEVRALLEAALGRSTGS